MTIDLDSTICEVHGKAKQGAAYGYTRVLGHHPLLATRSDTGEVLHARLPKGSSQRGAKRFVEELVARVRRAGATGALTLRADPAFWSLDLIDALGVSASAGPSPFRSPSEYGAASGHGRGRLGADRLPRRRRGPCGRDDLRPGSGRRRRGLRLAVRRSRVTDPAQLRLCPSWRHHAFVTDVELSTVEVDQFHRDHATVELAIRHLKEGAGMEHCPSGRFFANAAWSRCAVLAHNLVRWTARLGGVHPHGRLTVARSVRTQLLCLPGRLVNRSGRLVLRLPQRWPWAAMFTRALERIRALPLVPG